MGFGEHGGWRIGGRVEISKLEKKILILKNKKNIKIKIDKQNKKFDVVLCKL